MMYWRPETSGAVRTGEEEIERERETVIEKQQGIVDLQKEITNWLNQEEGKRDTFAQEMSPADH